MAQEKVGTEGSSWANGFILGQTLNSQETVILCDCKQAIHPHADQVLGEEVTGREVSGPLIPYCLSTWQVPEMGNYIKRHSLALR